MPFFTTKNVGFRNHKYFANVSNRSAVDWHFVNATKPNLQLCMGNGVFFLGERSFVDKPTITVGIMIDRDDTSVRFTKRIKACDSGFC